MFRFFSRFCCLMLGLFTFGLGIVLMIQADIGYAPWDAFHIGIALTFGLSFGTAAVLTSVAILIAVVILKEEIGLGTIFNSVMIGIFADLILFFDVIPLAAGYLLGIPMMIVGMFLVATGSYFYMKSSLGAGPRDSLMVAVNKKTSLSIGVCRSIVEFCAAAIHGTPRGAEHILVPVAA